MKDTIVLATHNAGKSENSKVLLNHWDMTLCLCMTSFLLFKSLTKQE